MQLGSVSKSVTLNLILNFQINDQTLIVGKVGISNYDIKKITQNKILNLTFKEIMIRYVRIELLEKKIL